MDVAEWWRKLNGASAVVMPADQQVHQQEMIPMAKDQDKKKKEQKKKPAKTLKEKRAEKKAKK